MPTPADPKLYARAKADADKVYKTSSAYKSGYIVRRYKALGGTYVSDGAPKTLKRWFREEWKDVAGLDYPVYRPTKRVSAKTPLTVDEVDPKNLRKQAKLKQKLREKGNLPPFKPKKDAAAVAKPKKEVGGAAKPKKTEVTKGPPPRPAKK